MLLRKRKKIARIDELKIKDVRACEKNKNKKD